MYLAPPNMKKAKRTLREINYLCWWYTVYCQFTFIALNILDANNSKLKFLVDC